MSYMEAMNLINELLQRENKLSEALLIDKRKLPAWIARAVKIYAIRLNQDEKLYLVKPNREIAFEQITNMLLQIRKRLGGLVLLVADEINPKYRALFVKNNVPFIYRDKSIFAPMLGLKLFDYKTPRPTKSRLIEEHLSHFEIKLLAGYLTGFIVQEGFNLNQFDEILQSNNYKCSKSKLSKSINHLIALNFLEVKGSGPNRFVTFKDRSNVWDELKNAQIKRFVKNVEGYYMLDGDYTLSGETALAQYSDLAEPRAKHIALTNMQLKKIEEHGVPVGHFGEPEYVFDVFKEPPELFAMGEGYLNPIELYFLLRNDPDERVQLSLEQMIVEIGLKG